MATNHVTDVREILSQGCTDQQCSLLANWVANELGRSKQNFATVLKQLSHSAQQVDGEAAVQSLLRCLLWCVQQQSTPAPVSPVVQHLLLEALPAGHALSASTRSLCLALFTDYCKASAGKLASKVASSFRLARGDLDDAAWQQLAATLLQMLQQPSTYKPAVFLMMQFEGLDELVNKSEVLTQLVADGQDTLAQQWATSLGRDYQVVFVEACIALDHLKPAARAVRQLGLAAEFPDVESMYRQRSLSRLMGKRLWSVALSYAGNDTALQTQLVRGMADAGELLLAQEFARHAGLPPDTLAPPDPSEIAAQEAARREAYLQLDLAGGQLLWVDDSSGCEQAGLLLSGSDVCGLDVEWKPSHLAGQASPAAVLQVATRTDVVLFDLISLCQHHVTALEAVLGPLLSSSSVLKLGFEVAGDLSKLASSWRSVQAFRRVEGVLDLKPLWIAYGVATRHKGGSMTMLSCVGLSTLCAALLGKPLDKSQQMSDWSARPLTDRQKQYAALDAVVLPQLYDALRQHLGPEVADKLVAQHTKTSTRNVPVVPEEAKEVPEVQQQPQPQRPGHTAAGQGSSAGGVEGSVTARTEAAAAQGVVANGAGAGWAAVGPSLGLPHVLAALRQHGLQDSYQKVNLVNAKGTHHVTSWDTAAAVGVPTSQVAKALMVLVGQQPHLLVTRGDQRIDMHKLAALLGVKRRAIVIAPEDKVEALTGFTSGVPPLSFNSSVSIIIDKRLALSGTEAATAATTPAPLQPPAAPTAAPTADCSLQDEPPAVSAAAAALGDTAGAVQPLAAASRPSSSNRGPAVVGASAMWPQQPPHVPAAAAAPAPDSAAAVAAGCPPASSPVSSAACAAQGQALLSVQCGRDAVLRLSFDQLVVLSGARCVADVADAPAEGGAVSTVTGTSTSSTATPGVGSTAAASPPKFLLDSMLGRLCRWLRALGVDAEFVEPGQQGHAQQQGPLLQQVQEAALLQGRLFVTRDQKLAMRRDVGGSVYLLASNDPAEQLAELSRHFGIRLDQSTLMSRCGKCNAAAYHCISHEEAARHVTPKLLELVDEFWQCGKCGQVVWMGPKSHAAISLLEGLFAEGKSRSTPLQSSRTAG